MFTLSCTWSWWHILTDQSNLNRPHEHLTSTIPVRSFPPKRALVLDHHSE